MTRVSAVSGVLITYRRPGQLRETLVRLATQSRALDSLYVVDNDADPLLRKVVEEAPLPPGRVRYIPAPENLGPAGRLELGTIAALDSLQDPTGLSSSTTTHRVRRGRSRTSSTSPNRCASRLRPWVAWVSWEAVSTCGEGRGSGSRKGSCRARYTRSTSAAASSPAIGPERFGSSGHRTVDCSSDSTTWNSASGWRRQGTPFTSAVSYGSRNAQPVIVLVSPRWSGAAARAVLRAVLLKPIYHASHQPHAALTHFVIGVRAVRDGYRDRMGRVVEPTTIPAGAITGPKTSSAGTERQHVP